MLRHLFIGVIALSSFAVMCRAATVTIGVDPRNTIPGVVANGILTDGEGQPWNYAQLLVELTSGSVYNGTPDTDEPQQAFWGTFPELQWDTWVGVPGDLLGSISNHAESFDPGPISMAGNKISVTWLTTSMAYTGLTQIANISLTDDATGTYAGLVFTEGQTVHFSGLIEDGAMSLQYLPPPFPEPGSLALLGLGALGLLTRSGKGV